MTTERMTPKRPKAEAKISMTRIFTKRVGFAASDKAAPDPVIPTETLKKCDEEEEGRSEENSGVRSFALEK